MEPDLDSNVVEEFDSIEWLVGGGEMGKAVRAFDWSRTSLGPRALWPQALRFAVGLCLNSRFPMFLWCGPDLINIYNDGYAPVLGHRHPAALGQRAPITWMDLWPDVAPQVQAVFERGEASWNDRVRLVTNRKGYDEEAYFTFSYSPAFDERGKVAALLCVVSEETAHVLAERRQAFLIDLSDLLRGLNRPGDIVAAAVDALGKHLKANRVGYGRVQADDETITLESSYADGVKPITGSFPLDSFGPKNIARQRQGMTVAHNDIADDSSNNPDTWAAIETRSFVSVPLVHEGRLRASLYVNQREVRFWLPEEITLIEDVSARIWEAVERARAEEEERKSEERLTFALKAGGGIGTWNCDVAADRLYCNAAFARLFSVDPERAAKGAPISEFLPGIHPDDRPGVAEKIASAYAVGGSYVAEYRVVLRDDSVRWLHARGRVELDGAGSASQFTGVVFDITDRKIVALRDAFLVQLDDATRPLTDPHKLTQTAARLLCEHMEANRCAYAEVDDDIGIFHITGDYNRNVPSIVGRYTIAQFGDEFTRLSRANEAYVVDDVEADPRVTDVQESYRQTQIRSVIAVPLHKDGRFVAGMAVHQATPRRWRPDEIELLRLVANRCWESIERGRIDRQLLEAQERLRLIIDDVPGLVSYMDRDLRYQFANRVYAEWFGRKGEAVVGKTVREIVGSEAFERARPFLERALQGEPARFEEFLPYENGQGRHVHVSYMPQTNSDGSVQGIVAMIQDITERKTAEQALLRSNNELREANADLEQFAYSASHDLKEPLRMVAIYSQMLKRRYHGRLDAEADQYLNVTVEGAKRMEALVGDLFAYMQAVTKTDEEVSTVAADTVLDQALSNLKSAVEESGVIIRRVALPKLRVQAMHLLQLFQNLIGNAIKYRGQRAPVIQVSTEREGNLWRLCVHDNGIGIQPEYHEQIFGIFKRLHTSDKYAGTGMGLAICQKIVHRYGGRIWVDSKGAGQGSAFCFTLPGAE